MDWPTAGFFRELSATYLLAKFGLTQRSPESWADSFGATIYRLLAGNDVAHPEMKAWLEMCKGVIARTGFPGGLDRDGLIRGFVAHNAAVRQAIRANLLLRFEVKDGWDPLCRFLNVQVPAAAFPRTNDRAEFWDRVTGKI